VFAAALFLFGLVNGSPIGASAAGGDHALFVQTNDPAGNGVIAYQRGSDGTLSTPARFDTGGKGRRVEGTVSDSLASQNGLIYDSQHGLLIGVNAGSDSIYAFRVDGRALCPIASSSAPAARCRRASPRMETWCTR
jgi:hypothetical protein